MKGKVKKISIISILTLIVALIIFGIYNIKVKDVSFGLFKRNNLANQTKKITIWDISGYSGTGDKAGVHKLTLDGKSNVFCGDIYKNLPYGSSWNTKAYDNLSSIITSTVKNPGQLYWILDHMYMGKRKSWYC